MSVGLQKLYCEFANSLEVLHDVLVANRGHFGKGLEGCRLDVFVLHDNSLEDPIHDEVPLLFNFKVPGSVRYSPHKGLNRDLAYLYMLRLNVDYGAM